MSGPMNDDGLHDPGRVAACALHPKPWKIHARREGSASVQVISYATREARDASVSWYEHTGYIVQTSGPK